jgi:methyl-accepting chemotaxis protein
MFCGKIKTEKQLIQSQLELQIAQWDSVESTMPCIEFMPDGTIIKANELFLQGTGYESTTEIAGQKHAIFVLPEERKSAAYQQFWKDLADGQAQSGRFLRIKKNGEKFYLNGNYFPIKNKDGKVTKVVKLANDVTESTLQQQENQAELDALDKVLGRISFDMSGTILDANALFLDIVGYTLEEVKGQHHSIFVKPEYKASPEYTAFWQYLNDGKSTRNRFERIGKGGVVAWLDGSYNPLFDMDGNPFKVVKYCQDITKMVEDEQLLKMSASILDSMSEGDLTHNVEYSCTGDWEVLRTAVNHVNDSLNTAFCKVKTQATDVGASAKQVAESNNDLSDRIQRQAAAVEQTAATMQELTSQVNESANRAEQSKSISETAVVSVQNGSVSMQETIDAMAAIKEVSDQITDIVSLIDGIAFQTNLLALNAAVEAARAGEHGRGFAVVAGEVRNLAGRSADAAKDISTLIVKTTERIQQGTDKVQTTASILSGLEQQVSEVSQLVSDIAINAHEQAQGIEQGTQAINEFDSSLQQNAALVEENAALSEHLDDLGKSLNELVAGYTLKDCR